MPYFKIIVRFGLFPNDMVIQLRYEYIPSPVTKLQTKKEQTPTLVAKLNNFPSLPYTNTYEEITSDFKKPFFLEISGMNQMS